MVFEAALLARKELTEGMKKNKMGRVVADLDSLLETLGEVSPLFFDEAGTHAEPGVLTAIIGDLASELAEHAGSEPLTRAGFDLERLRETLEAADEATRRYLLALAGVLGSKAAFGPVTEALAGTPGLLAGGKWFWDLFDVASKTASLVDAASIPSDVERGEELVRKVGRVLGWKFAGESVEESNARLLQVDSVEIDRVQKEVERRIQRELEEARKREAAAKVSRE
ncbi:MAG: hypothetical protein Kow0069_33240 [Promethearchaeota archaeon]